MPQQLLSLSSLPKIQALLVPAAASLWGLGGCGMGDTLGRVGAAGAEVCQEKLEKPWQVPRSPNRPAISRGPRGGGLAPIVLQGRAGRTRELLPTPPLCLPALPTDPGAAGGAGPVGVPPAMG